MNALVGLLFCMNVILMTYSLLFEIKYNTKITVCCDVIPYNLVDRYQCTGRTCFRLERSLGIINLDVWGSGGIVPPFFTSAMDGSEWSSFQFG